VHAYVDQARLEKPLVEGVEELLVVHPPRVLGKLLVGVWGSGMNSSLDTN
jgi:hypothetical protein